MAARGASSSHGVIVLRRGQARPIGHTWTRAQQSPLSEQAWQTYLDDHFCPPGEVLLTTLT